MVECAIAGDSGIADPDCAIPGDSVIDDMACSAAGNGSLTVLLITRASGLNRYHNAAPETTAVPMSIDLRVVMLLSFQSVWTWTGETRYPRPLPLSVSV